MPEEQALPQEVASAQVQTDGSAVTTNPVETAPPSAGDSTAELTEEAIAAGFTAEDFANPTYGAKAKNLYKGFQKATTRASKTEKDLAELQAAIRYDPELRGAFTKYAKSRGYPVPEDGTQVAPQPEVQPGLSPTAETKLRAELALRDWYYSLGAGDPVKGKEIFEKEYDAPVAEVFRTINSNDPQTITRFLMEYMALKKAASTKTPPPPPATTGGGEKARGSDKPAPPVKTGDPWEDAMQAAMRKHGVTNLNDLMRTE